MTSENSSALSCGDVLKTHLLFCCCAGFTHWPALADHDRNQTSWFGGFLSNAEGFINHVMEHCFDPMGTLLCSSLDN